MDDIYHLQNDLWVSRGVAQWKRIRPFSHLAMRGCFQEHCDSAALESKRAFPLMLQFRACDLLLASLTARLCDPHQSTLTYLNLPSLTQANGFAIFILKHADGLAWDLYGDFLLGFPVLACWRPDDARGLAHPQVEEIVSPSGLNPGNLGLQPDVFLVG